MTTSMQLFLSVLLFFHPWLSIFYIITNSMQIQFCPSLYIALIFFPFKNCSCVIRLGCGGYTQSPREALGLNATPEPAFSNCIIYGGKSVLQGFKLFKKGSVCRDVAQLVDDLPSTHPQHCHSQPCRNHTWWHPPIIPAPRQED